MKHEMTSAGEWFLRPDTHELFQVIDCDDDSGAVRIQMFDGSLDEIEADVWRALSPQPVEQPEDWSGALDCLETDELDGSATAADGQTEDWLVDHREPWEYLVAESAMDMDALQNQEWQSALGVHSLAVHRTVNSTQQD